MKYTVKSGCLLPRNSKTTRTDENGRPILTEKLSASKLRMFRVKAVSLELDEEGKPRVHVETLPFPESRTARILERYSGSTEHVKKSLRLSELSDGTEVSIERKTMSYTINGDPMIVVNLHKDPGPKKDRTLFNKSQAITQNGLRFNVNGEIKKYVWAYSAAAQMLTHKAYFVREDFRAPKKYLRELEERGGSKEAEIIRNMGAADTLRTMITYGAYLDTFLGKEHNHGNVIARIGLAGSSSKSLGNDIRVGCFGKIYLSWNIELERSIRKSYESRFPTLDDRTSGEIDATVRKTKETWKQEKWDGQNIIRASYLAKVFRRRFGIKISVEDIAGRVILDRFNAGGKGTTFVATDDYMDSVYFVVPGAKKVLGVFGLEDEVTYPYAGYDLVVEGNSQKFEAGKAWHGEPELEVCHVDSLKASSYVDMQTEQALDLITGDLLRQLCDSLADRVRASFTDPLMANTIYGITGDDPLADSLEVNTFKEKQSTVTAAALAAYPDIVKDPSFRMRTVSFVFKSYRNGRDFTKIPVDGSTRFVITDPSAFFRTDLAVFRRDKDGNLILNREGIPLFDIVITSPSQLALQEPDLIWDNGDTRKCILSRNPCVHPGEIVPARGASLEDVKELDTGMGTMDFKPMFKSVTRSFILSAVSAALDIMGGADTDGDRIRKIAEPSIVAMHSPYRFPLLISIKPDKPVGIVSSQSLAEYRATRLVDANVGLITSTAAAWRDLQHQCKEVYRAFKAGADRKEWKLHPLCADDLQRAIDVSRQRIKAEITSMLPDEVEAVNAISSIKEVNKDAHLAGPDGWVSLVYAAGEKVLAVLRRLQEIAISSNKTSAWVDMSAYKWLALYARPSWYSPAGKKIYPSRSPLGQMRRYMVQMEKGLRASVAVGSRMIPEMAEIFKSRASMADYQTIRQLMADYGSRKRFLIEKVESDELRINAFDKIAKEYNLQLMALAQEVGVDVVSAMVYTAVYDRNENLGEHSNFLWACWGEQFVSTLKHISSGMDIERIIPFTPVKSMERKLFPDAVYKVESGKVYQGLDLVATTKAADGLYGVKLVNRRQFLVKMVSQKTSQEATASYQGLKFQIIGWSHKTYGEKVMTRSMGRELIERAGGLIHITAEDLGNKVISNVNVIVDGSDIPVGNIPMAGAAGSNDGFLSRALCGLTLRVAIPGNVDAIDGRGYTKERMERAGLTVEIVEVLSGGDDLPEDSLYEEDGRYYEEGLAEAW